MINVIIFLVYALPKMFLKLIENESKLFCSHIFNHDSEGRCLRYHLQKICIAGFSVRRVCRAFQGPSRDFKRRKLSDNNL